MEVPPVSRNLERAAAWSWRLLVCAAALAAALTALWYLKVIVLPSIVALTATPVLAPLTRMLRRRIGRSAAAASLAVGIVAVAGLFALVTSAVVADYDQLRVSVARSVDDITNRLSGEPFNLSPADVKNFDADLGTVWKRTSGYLFSGLSTGAALITGLILAVAVLYFLLRDGPAFWRWILGRFPAAMRPELDRAGRRSWDVLGGFVRGTALIALIDAVLIGLGLWLLGVPLAFPLAVLIFLGGFVPFVGATITGLVAVLVAFADQGWARALIALGIVLGVQFLEGNFLQPIIQSRTVDLHPAVILLAVAAGGSLFGIIGAYLAVPVTAVVFAAVSALRADVGDEVGEPNPR